MGETQILLEIADLQNIIAEVEAEIRLHQKDIDELESLRRKLVRARDEISDIIFDSKKKMHRLAALVSYRFLERPTSLLEGTEFARILAGIDSAGNAAKTRARLLEDEIQQLRNRIGQYQCQITSLEGQLTAIRMEV